MKVYICRWPNGDCTVVVAPNKRDAILLLDELGGANPNELTELTQPFMADFRVADDGLIELNEFGELVTDEIWEACYPKLRKLLVAQAMDEESVSAEQIKTAVEHEQARLWKTPRGKAKTLKGQEIANVLGTSGAAADIYVKDLATQILQKTKVKKGRRTQ